MVMQSNSKEVPQQAFHPKAVLPSPSGHWPLKAPKHTRGSLCVLVQVWHALPPHEHFHGVALHLFPVIAACTCTTVSRIPADLPHRSITLQTP